MTKQKTTAVVGAIPIRPYLVAKPPEYAAAATPPTEATEATESENA